MKPAETLNQVQVRVRTGFWLCVLLLVMAFFPDVRAQGQPDRGDRNGLEETDMRTSRSGAERLTLPGIALEGTVDPAEYHLGPSDVLAVNLASVSLTTYTVSVTPEGTVIVPTVGEIPVANLTLAEAKQVILSEIRKKYLTGKATVTLLVPRPIIVLVSGHVLHPGMYELTAVSRANKALEEANTPRRGESAEAGEKFVMDGSTRNIVLKHRDGTESRVDLVKFMAVNQGRWNPFLREGDIIVVPRKDPARHVVAIYGEVNSPGRFEHVEGDSIRDLLNIAHGFTPLARTDSVEFYRLSRDGSDMSRSVISWEALSSRQLADNALQPGDRVFVRTKPDLREDYNVMIAGEVVSPGTYPITKNTTRLSEVIRRAGGFTEFASLGTAELSRRSVSPEDLDYEQRVSLRGGTSAEDSAYFVLETDLRIRKEIVNVDFRALFSRGDSTLDVVLQTGDYVSIPSAKKTVYVYGQVVSPGHVPFDPNATVDRYIAQAGGLTEHARSDDLRIIKAKTRQWLMPGETTIEGGDYIWVPKETEYSFGYYIAVLSQSAAVLSVIIGMWVLIAQSGK